MQRCVCCTCACAQSCSHMWFARIECMCRNRWLVKMFWGLYGGGWENIWNSTMKYILWENEAWKRKGMVHSAKVHHENYSWWPRAISLSDIVSTDKNVCSPITLANYNTLLVLTLHSVPRCVGFNKLAELAACESQLLDITTHCL